GSRRALGNSKAEFRFFIRWWRSIARSSGATSRVFPDICTTRSTPVVRSGVSSRFQQPDLRKAVREMVGEMCPHPAPATLLSEVGASRVDFRVLLRAAEVG